MLNFVTKTTEKNVVSLLVSVLIIIKTGFGLRKMRYE